MRKVLVVDDDRGVRHLIQSGLGKLPNIEILVAEDGNQAIDLIKREEPSVCLLDVYLPEHHGLELFRQIRSLDSKLLVIFITGDTTSETAIEAMRAGAYDYLAKPLNLEQVRNLTVSAIKSRELMDRPVALPIGEPSDEGERFVGNSKSMIEVFKSIGRVAAQNVTVLVRGESGSGKELVARAIVNHSKRSDRPFVAVNCAAIPDQLLEGELFGHEKGAFTGADKRRIGRFEQCNGGTIFLDEVGDMSPATQGKVLRLLQEQTFERVGGNETISTDVRIITATNRPLEEMVAKEEFREDLLYRLNSFMIHLPPLRERREDIPELLEYFLRRAKSEMERSNLTGIAPDALQKLLEYDWPGNVRQLQSVVRQSLINTPGTVIGGESIPDFVRGSSKKSKVGSHTPDNTKSIGDDSATHSQTSPQLFEPTGENSETNLPQDAQVEEPTMRDNERMEDDFLVMQFIEERLAAGSTELYDETLEQIERRLFARVLAHTGGNQSKTAEILGITRGKVRDRIDQYNIQMDRTVTIQDE